MRRDFLAIPKKWLRMQQFFDLTKKELHLLLLVFDSTTTGLVPRIGKRAQVELRLPHAPKALGDMLLKLRNKGFLEDESATHYKVKDWERFVGKYNRNEGKPKPKHARKKQEKSAQSTTCTDLSRAPAPLSYRRGVKEEDIERPSDEALKSPPHEYPERVLELMQKYGAPDNVVEMMEKHRRQTDD